MLARACCFSLNQFECDRNNNNNIKREREKGKTQGEKV